MAHSDRSSVSLSEIPLLTFHSDCQMAAEPVDWLINRPMAVILIVSLHSFDVASIHQHSPPGHAHSVLCERVGGTTCDWAPQVDAPCGYRISTMIGIVLLESLERYYMDEPHPWHQLSGTNRVHH